MNKALFWAVVAAGEGPLGQRAFSLLRTYNPLLASAYKRDLSWVVSENDPNYRDFQNFVNRNW